MHEFIMSIGYAVIGFFLNINWETVLNALSITVTGWLGIFIVTAVIIGVVYVLKFISSKLPSDA